MPRFHGVAIGAGVIAAALSVTSAFADSRIFTVKASEPGVTIDQAFRNGKELAVAWTDSDGVACLPALGDNLHPRYVLVEQHSFFISGRPRESGLNEYYIPMTLFALK